MYKLRHRIDRSINSATWTVLQCYLPECAFALAYDVKLLSFGWNIKCPSKAFFPFRRSAIAHNLEEMYKQIITGNGGDSLRGMNKVYLSLAWRAVSYGQLTKGVCGCHGLL